MSLIYQSYLSFQTPMYTWKSAPTTTAATLVIPSSTTPEKTTTTVEEQQDPVIHDLCLQFYRSMLITTISNTTNINPEIDELCHSFRFMYVHDDDKDDQREDDDDQQQHYHHDNHIATSATATAATTTTMTSTTATASAMQVVLNDPIMEALCAQMQSLSIHHVFQPIQKKRSLSTCADGDDDNNDCPISAKRQRIH